MVPRTLHERADQPLKRFINQRVNRHYITSNRSLVKMVDHDLAGLGHEP